MMTGSQQRQGSSPTMHQRLIASLYIDAMLIADEARAYFEERGRDERDALTPAIRVGFSCEALNVTTRLMHVVAWLLTQRAVEAGELSAAEALDPARRLGAEPVSNAGVVALMPAEARRLVAESVALYRRAAGYEAAVMGAVPTDGPARAMQAMIGVRL